MSRAEDIINQNKSLIDRFVNLASGKDSIFDSRHFWFYSLISKDKVAYVSNFLSEDDIRHQIYVHVIEQTAGYKESDKMLANYLKKSIGWYVKDYLNTICRQYEHDVCIEPPSTASQAEPVLNLNWLVHNNHFTGYEKYLLFLYVEKCYTINRIAAMLYQERTTIRDTLNKVKHKFRRHYARTKRT